MASRTTISGVVGVAVEVGDASGLTSDGEAGSVEGAFERPRAVGAKVLSALCDRASASWIDPHGEVVTIDKRHCTDLRLSLPCRAK